MGLSEATLIGLAFASVSGVVYLLCVALDPYRHGLRRRIDVLSEESAGPKADGTSQRPADPATSWLVENVQKAGFGQWNDRKQARDRLAMAGLYDPAAVSRYFAFRTCAIAVPAIVCCGLALGGVIRPDIAMLSAGLCGALGAVAPSFWLDRRIAHHHLLIGKSLPDLLDLMTVCVEGGLSLQETVRRVSDELRIAHPVLADELAIVQRDIELGATVDRALKKFATRSNHEGVSTLSTFIREAQRFGTNITEALRSHADMLRAQRELSAEEKAQKTAVKILIPTLLLIFPAIFVVAVGPAVLQIQEAFASK